MILSINRNNTFFLTLIKKTFKHKSLFIHFHNKIKFVNFNSNQTHALTLNYNLNLF